MNKKLQNLLNDLYKIGYQQGLHNGRWEDEYQEQSTEFFFNSMIDFAKKYNIKTLSKKEYLEDSKYKYLIEEEDYFEYQVLDEVATDIKDEIKKVIYDYINTIVNEYSKYMRY